MKVAHLFRDPALLELALTHPSFANEQGVADNQRLEFLGDAVLQLVVTELLVERLPDWNEGQLHTARTNLVNTATLAAVARELELGPALRLGRGEAKAGRDNPGTLEDALEAVIAAIHLDGEIDAARALLTPIFRPRIEALATGAPVNARNTLQEWLEANGRAAPVYAVVETTGPPHARIFHVAVTIDGETFGPAQGPSKRAAAAAAAAMALEALTKAGAGVDGEDDTGGEGSGG